MADVTSKTAIKAAKKAMEMAATRQDRKRAMKGEAVPLGKAGPIPGPRKAEPNHKAKKKTALAPRHSTEGKPDTSPKTVPQTSKRIKPEA